MGGNHPGLELRILPYTPTAESATSRVSTGFYYLTFRNGIATAEDFANYLADEIVPFCLPRVERERVNSRFRTDSPEMARHLFRQEYEKARRLFIRANDAFSRSGECAELILYLLLEHYLRAPQLVSKMYLKTATAMPVHGSDGIHVALDTDGTTLIHYLGESKGYSELASAIDDALDSVEHVRSHESMEREIDILVGHMDTGADTRLRDELAKFFDPYEAQSNARKSVHALLIGFSWKFYKHLSTIPAAHVEKRFLEQYSLRAKSAIQLLERKLAKRGMQDVNIHAMFLPLPSISNLRSLFQKAINYGDPG